MRAIIAGSRSLGYQDLLNAFMDCPWGHEITTVVSGTAKGMDEAGELWAERHNANIVRFPADWARYGRGAGFKRNREMAEFSDALVAVWDGKSPGTKNMITTAKSLGLRVFVFDVSLNEFYEFNNN